MINPIHMPINTIDDVETLIEILINLNEETFFEMMLNDSQDERVFMLKVFGDVYEIVVYDDDFQTMTEIESLKTDLVTRVQMKTQLRRWLCIALKGTQHGSR